MNRLLFAVSLPVDHGAVEGIRDDIEAALFDADLDVDEMSYRHDDGELDVVIVVPPEMSTAVAELCGKLERAVPGSIVSFVRGESGPAAVRAIDRKTPRRYVNTWIAEDGVDEPCTAGLRPDTDHVALVRIGEYDRRSLLPRTDAEWWPPDDANGFVVLTAVLAVAGAGSTQRSLRLPADGPSTACSCDEVDHAATCLRRDWARLPFVTHRTLGPTSATIQICRGTIVLHAQELLLTIGQGPGPEARVATDLTRTFDELGGDDDRPRSASVHLSADQVIVRARGASVPYRVGERGADDEAKAVRDALYDVHFSPDDRATRSRFDHQQAKAFPEYAADLGMLAQAGWKLFDGLFDVEMQEMLGNMPGGVVADLQITGSGTSGLPVLWPLLYDMPLSGIPQLARLCPSVDEFGPGGDAEGAIPTSCPHRDTHEGDTICPFGFWGLAHHLEQIPGGRTWNLLEGDPGTGELALSLVVGPRIPVPTLLDDHVLRLGGNRYSVDRTDARTHDDVAEALAEETSVAYLLSHCGFEGNSGIYLDYEQKVFPRTVSFWRRSKRHWPPDHWRRRRPLVVLNGCHTMHSTSGTLATFVEKFIEAGASGVIGSEVLVTQEVGCWAMELLLAELAAGREMAAAVRTMRWSMLRRGNLMGLAYSPYCLVDHRLQKAPSERHP